MDAFLESLSEKIRHKTARVAVIGLGYVGIPLAKRFADEGIRVLGVDVDAEKIERLSRGQTYIKHIPDRNIQGLLATGFEPTSDFSKIKECDVTIICVPTPLGRHREPDMSYIVGAIESIRPYLKKGGAVVLESTTYPGTTDELIARVLEKDGFEIGRDMFVIFSPEREDPGRIDFNTKTTPKVVGGVTEACGKIGVALYGTIIDKIVPVSSARAAELTKLLENIHRAVNIGLVNEMKIVCDKMNIDIHEVIDAAATKPFGFVAYRPGPGLGGHCIPIDPFYLTWKAREYGVNTKFIELAGEINNQMPAFVVAKVKHALNEVGRSVKDAKILMLGLSYKKNVDDHRESPSFVILEELDRLGARLSFADPHFETFPANEHFHKSIPGVQLDRDTLSSFDLVLLITDHDSFPYAEILEYSKLIVDTRGRFRRASSKVVQA